jgi:sugar lactone lactonase YvrE
MIRPPMRIAVFALATFLTLTAGAQTYEELTREMRTAYDAKDYARFLAVLQRMDVLRPNHPTVLINTAGAYALSGRPDEALSVLRRILAMKVFFDTSDADFDALRGDARFVQIERELQQLRAERVAGAEVAFTIPGKGLIPEGVTRDAATGDLYVTGVRKGTLHRISRQGRVERVPLRGGTIRGLSGAGIDAPRRILWACNTASPRWEGFTKGATPDATLIAVDLRDGKVTRQLPLPGEGAFCDDLTVGRDGTVYVSDSRGRVVRLSPNADALETLVPNGRIRSPQGSALSANGRLLYVADYGGPVRAVDVRTGDVVALRAPEDFQPMGIDGLTRHGQSLIAVQNGINPIRVVRLDLSADGLAIERATILEMNHPQLDEPTIGVAAEGAYYFIGASQGNRFDREVPDEKGLVDAMVFRIRLAR